MATQSPTSFGERLSHWASQHPISSIGVQSSTKEPQPAKSEWVTVEERQRHWLIFIPFRFAFWCVIWATILVLAFHPSSEVGAAGTIILASISTFSAKTKTRQYRVRK